VGFMIGVAEKEGEGRRDGCIYSIFFFVNVWVLCDTIWERGRYIIAP